MDDAFDPADTTWTPVSAKLRAMRRMILVGALAAFALVVAGIAVAASLPYIGVGGAVVVGIVTAVGWRWIGRNQRAWGYTERDDDLLVRRGVAFRELIVVPYGRMQFVDVTDGPVQRRFGLSTVQLHTAAAKTDARIPGLTPSEAARLRDRLTARGESHAAGL